MSPTRCRAITLAANNHRVAIQPGRGHGLRLLPSHAGGGAGEPVAAAVARGALKI